MSTAPPLQNPSPTPHDTKANPSSLPPYQAIPSYIAPAMALVALLTNMDRYQGTTLQVFEVQEYFRAP